jgi:hypothetical protein
MADGSRAGDVSLCFGTSDACTDDGCTEWLAWAKKASSMSSVTVWMTRNVTPETQSTFLRASGLPTWESADLPGGERSVELAAEIMSGALMDELHAEREARASLHLRGAGHAARGPRRPASDGPALHRPGAAPRSAVTPTHAGGPGSMSHSEGPIRGRRALVRCPYRR